MATGRAGGGTAAEGVVMAGKAGGWVGGIGPGRVGHRRGAGVGGRVLDGSGV